MRRLLWPFSICLVLGISQILLDREAVVSLQVLEKRPSIMSSESLVAKDDDQIVSFNKGVTESALSLRSGDSYSLHSVKEQIELMISKNNRLAENYILSIHSRAVNLSAEQIFLVLESFITAHKNPVPTIVDFIGKVSEQEFKIEEHSHSISDYQKLVMASAFALDKLSDMLLDADTSSSNLSRLEALLLINVKAKRDLMVVRHSLVKLKEIFSYSEAELGALVSHRDKSELYAYADLIKY